MSVPLPPVTPGAINLINLRELVGKSAPIILEIGVNDGWHTLEFLKLFPNARIYAFEPDPRAFAKFKVNVTDHRVSVFEMAIGSKDGEAEFHVSSGLPPNLSPVNTIDYPQGWDMSGSLRPPKTHKIFWPWCKFEKQINVQVRRLDSWIRENGVPCIDLIWADTQGAEGDLIAGGIEALAKTRFFYTEYSNDEWYAGQPNLEKILEMLPNFNVVHRFTMDVLLKNTAMQSSKPSTCVPADVTIDAEWYLSQYPDVRAAILNGSVKSALDHYHAHGYFEKRLPSKPVVDEAWYLQTNPDVAQAIREGRETSAYNHFVKFGYREGRMPLPYDTVEIAVSQCVDVQLVRRLIERLHPITTDKGLIRIGREGDGGYLVPDDLDDVVACFSPGVGAHASFEAALIARGIPCYLADGSIAGPPIHDTLIQFDKKFVGVVNDDTTITLDAWVKTCAPPDGDLILQMDIEGVEWPVLRNVSDEVLKRFRIIVVELHDLERLLDKVGFELIFAALDRLLHQFNVVHSHPNNVALPVNAEGLTIPRLLEVTFLRQDRAEPTGHAKQFPHPLDRKNLPDRPDLVLPAEWYRTAN